MLLKNEKGLSLVELMVAVGIGGFVMVMGMSTLVSMSNQNATFMQTMSADMEQMRAISVVGSVFAQAVELKSFGPGNMNGYTSAATGRIREDYDSNLEWAGANGTATQTLAVFWRDAAHSTAGSPAAVATSFLPTAVYFQPPTLTTFGVLYINLGATASLAPTRSDFIVENLTRVRIRNVTVYQADPAAPIPNPPVTGFDIELTVRHFLDGQKELMAQRTYCPNDLELAGVCANVRPHKDIANTYHVNVRNNILDTSLTGSRASRLYDQIHFFAPHIPGGL